MIPTLTFADLRQQYRSIKPEIDAAITAVVDKGQFILGEETRLFEAEFAAHCENTFCVGCASGTDALALSLRGLGVGPGDEVIVPALSFFATAEAVCVVGATPVFADVEADTALMDPSAVSSLLSPRTRALLPVHLFGQMADMTALMALARAHELLVVEDAAQAHGARHAGRRAGSLGHAAAFSFFPGKNLGAYGDGGAVVTASRRLSDWLMMARQHGSRQKFQHEFIGTNSRLDELQAAILRVKLKHLDAWNSRRREIAKLYDRELAEVCEVRPLRVKVEDESARHLYVVRLPQRDRVQDDLQRQGIQTAAHYPSLLADQPALAAAARTSPATRVAKELSHQVLSLPIHPDLCDSDVLRISAALKACFVTRSP